MRRISDDIADVEPRFDPTVFPHPTVDMQKGKLGQINTPEHGSWCLHEPQPNKNSVASYHSLYLSGELTPLDVVHAILPLIRRDVPAPSKHSTAWISSQINQVLEAAKASTLRYKAGKSLGPLDGVPTGVKDEYDLEDYMTSHGAANDFTGQKTNAAEITSWCVLKLLEAGAIVMGKLSMHEFGLGRFYRPTANSLHRFSLM